MFSMLRFCATVIIYFKDFAFGGFDTIVVAVSAQPPPFAAKWAFTKSVIMPSFYNLSNHIFTVIKTERNRNLDLAACSDINLPTKELWSHDIKPTMVKRRRSPRSSQVSSRFGILVIPFGEEKVIIKNISAVCLCYLAAARLLCHLVFSRTLR